MVNRCLSVGREVGFRSDGDEADIEGLTFVTLALGFCAEGLKGNVNGDVDSAMLGALKGVLEGDIGSLILGSAESTRLGLKDCGVKVGSIDGTAAIKIEGAMLTLLGSLLLAF